MPGYKQKHSCQNTGYSNRSDFTYNLALHFSILLENEISKQQGTYGTKINFFFLNTVQKQVVTMLKSSLI